MQCVPYARERSGIPIRGDAHTWWKQAKGKYRRSNKPKEGAVMVLSKTSRLRHGHLAVVEKIIDSRTIEVAHSNWGSDRDSRCVIYKAMPVRDVSKRGDWSCARFFNYETNAFGSPYKVSGFIYP
jgi:surface antigen